MINKEEKLSLKLINKENGKNNFCGKIQNSFLSSKEAQFYILNDVDNLGDIIFDGSYEKSDNFWRLFDGKSNWQNDGKNVVACLSCDKWDIVREKTSSNE